jgi:stringent starvation protein A
VGCFAVEGWMMIETENRKSAMTLFSVATCPHSHRARIALAEKELEATVTDVDPDNMPDDLQTFSPYNVMPAFVDRDLVLYEARVIMEYIDERFPHPPLLPMDPGWRAKARLVLYRIEEDWYEPLYQLQRDENPEQARKRLRESLIEISSIFKKNSWFLGGDFGLVDCTIAPVLWRLPYYNIELPTQAKNIEQYAQRLFSRRSFQQSLSKPERAMR